MSQFSICRNISDLGSMVRGCTQGRTGATKGPCTEPYIKGVNVLRDPGFENHINIPNGPSGEDFPGDGSLGGNATGPLYWMLDGQVTDLLYYDVSGWGVWSNNYGLFDWPDSGQPALSSANPRSGSYHWRVHYDADTYGNETFPIPIGGRFCSGLKPYSGRCIESSLITFSVWASFSTTVGSPRLEGTINFFDSSGVWHSQVLSPVYSVTSTGYINYQISAVAPAGAYCFTCWWWPYMNSGTHNAVDMDMDDFVLSIA